MSSRNNNIEMTYTKDPNMKYTDMCIYIEKHMRELVDEDVDNRIVENVHKYLYLVIYMLACKEKYFPNIDDYDDFALQTAAIIYMRLADKRQYLPDDDPAKIKQIKNLLDYLKNCLRGLKVNYQQQNYAQSLPPNILYDRSFEDDMKANIQSDYFQGLNEAIIDAVNTLPDIIINILKTSPYRNDKLMVKNLYLSILLSFIDTITAPANLLTKIERKKDNCAVYDKLFIDVYKEQQKNDPILYHIDKTLSDYVKLCLNKVKKEFCKDLVDTKISYELPDDVLEDIMSSVYETANLGDNYEEE